MKKIYLTILSFTLILGGFAQEFSNRTETNCSGQQQSAYRILNQGQVLFIVSAGFDCSLCQATAASIKKYADENKDNIAFWGALSYLYNQSTEPNCTAVMDWERSNNWTSLFNFADSEVYYSESGLPNYKVINPQNKHVAYDGDDFKKATETADKLLQSASSKSAEQNLEKTLTITSSGELIKLNFNASQSGEMVINLYDITGKVIDSRRVDYSTGNNYITLGNESSLRNGIYILNLKAGPTSLSRKISVY